VIFTSVFIIDSVISTNYKTVFKRISTTMNVTLWPNWLLLCKIKWWYLYACGM